MYSINAKCIIFKLTHEDNQPRKKVIFQRIPNQKNKRKINKEKAIRPKKECQRCMHAYFFPRICNVYWTGLFFLILKKVEKIFLHIFLYLYCLAWTHLFIFRIYACVVFVIVSLSFSFTLTPYHTSGVFIIIAT